MFRCSDVKTFSVMIDNMKKGLPMFHDLPLYVIFQSNGRWSSSFDDCELGYVTFRFLPDHSNSFYMINANDVLGYFPELLESEMMQKVVQHVQEKDFFVGPDVIDQFVLTHNMDGSGLTFKDAFEALKVGAPTQVLYTETMTKHEENAWTERLEQRWVEIELNQQPREPMVDFASFTP